MSKPTISIGRHPENITLNPLEFILDENDEVMEFINNQEALDFLSTHDINAKDEEELDEKYGFILWENNND